MKAFWITFWVLLLYYGCTKDITLDLPDPKSLIVVEGFIENEVPPTVLLTKNSPYFGGINLNDLSQYFVRGATITVFDDLGDTVILREFCSVDFPEEFRRELIRSLGFEIDDTIDIPDFCIYTVPNILQYILGNSQGVFLGREFGKYGLRVESGETILTAQTSIPGIVPIEELYHRPHPDPKKDSLVSVYVTFTEPDTLGNFLRYFTARNSEPFYPPLSGSVYDDKLFNGRRYSLPLERGQSRSEEFDLDTYSYFLKGDTAYVRWCTLDKAHYDFWRTIENDGGDSPFSAPVKIRSNINGGLGIWGGYGCYTSSYIVPR